MPHTFELLETLPGIGRYTAGAIASIAFGCPVPAVDGNVLRVMSRLTMNDGDVLNQKVKKQIEDQVREKIPAERAGDFTQAMIELGAIVCVPNGGPHCAQCPFEDCCMAHLHRCEQDFPHKAPGKGRRLEEKTVLLLLDGEKVALRKRPDGGLLAGMYEFPMLEGFHSREEVLEFCRKEGLQPLHIKDLSDAKHIFSHVEWHMKGYAIRVDELRSTNGGKKTEDWLFVKPQEAGERFPIPSACASYAKYLNILQGSDKFSKETEGDLL